MYRLEPVKVKHGIMIIGINPSEKAFPRTTDCWDSIFGRYLEGILNEAGIKKDQVWLTNLYKSPTPNNRPLNDEEILQGFAELEEEAKECDPKFIVTLGSQVAEVFMVPLWRRTMKAVFGKTRVIVSLPHTSWLRRASGEDKERFISSLHDIK